MPELEPGSMVVLTSLPPGLLTDLPDQDQRAIQSIVGQPVLLAGYSYGEAELEFVDSDGDNHSIWVKPELLRAA